MRRERSVSIEESVGQALESYPEGIKKAFGSGSNAPLLEKVTRVNIFRNTYIAHHEKALSDPKQAEIELKFWVETLAQLT